MAGVKASQQFDVPPFICDDRLRRALDQAAEWSVGIRYPLGGRRRHEGCWPLMIRRDNRRLCRFTCGERNHAARKRSGARQKALGREAEGLEQGSLTDRVIAPRLAPPFVEKGSMENVAMRSRFRIEIAQKRVRFSKPDRPLERLCFMAR